MVGGTFAFGFNQHPHILQFFIGNGFERLQQLQAFAVFRHRDFNCSFCRGYVTGVSNCKSCFWQLNAFWRIESYHLSFFIQQGVLFRVEHQIARNGECRYNFGRSHKCMGVLVAVVSFGEISVVGGHDGVGAIHIVNMPRPLPNARAAGIGQYHAAYFFKIAQQPVSLCGKSYLFGARGDCKFCLDFNTFLIGLTCNGGSAGKVFVTRIGARTNEANFKTCRIIVLFYGSGKFGQRPRQIGGEWTIDVRLKFVQINLDHLIKVFFRVSVAFSIAGQVFGHLVAHRSYFTATGSLEIARHALIVSESRGSRADLCAHVADGAFTRATDA